MSKILLTVGAVYLVIVAALFVFQRKLLYLPAQDVLPPEHYGLEGFDDISLTASDNVKLQCWHKPAAPGMPTILYFHGNASHIGNRAGIYHSFAQQGFGVLALSYRGYGKSEGSPSEKGILKDAQALIGYAKKVLKLTDQQIVLYGESLGSGVAVHTASKNSVGAIILEAPYLSVARRAAEIYFYVPVHLLIKDKFESYRKIHRVKAPLLLFHGMEDATIPAGHGKALFELANEPKQAHFFEDTGHNDFDRDVISAHVLDFAKTHKLVTNP